MAKDDLREPTHYPSLDIIRLNYHTSGRTLCPSCGRQVRDTGLKQECRGCGLNICVLCGQRNDGNCNDCA